MSGGSVGVAPARQILTGRSIAGGGNLSADRTLRLEPFGGVVVRTYDPPLLTFSGGQRRHVASLVMPTDTGFIPLRVDWPARPAGADSIYLYCYEGTGSPGYPDAVPAGAASIGSTGATTDHWGGDAQIRQAFEDLSVGWIGAMTLHLQHGLVGGDADWPAIRVVGLSVPLGNSTRSAVPEFSAV